MVTRGDIRDLRDHTRDDDGSGEFILGIESASDEAILADGDYTSYSFKSVQIPRDGKQYLNQVLLDLLNGFIEDFEENRSLEVYDIRTVDQDHTPIQYISTDEIPNPHRFSPVFEEYSIDETTTYEEAKPYFQSYKLNINPIIAGFRVFTNWQVVSAENEFRMYAEDDGYSQFERNLISLPDEFDAVYFDGEIIINNPNNFEKMFDYFEVYREHADNILTEIRESEINIENFDEFIESIVGDRRALRKMKEIEDVGLYQSIERRDVERVIDEFDLTISVDGSGEDWEIVIPDMRHKWDVIRLLNDDHLYSDLTDGRYQVYGKERRE